MNGMSPPLMLPLTFTGLDSGVAAGIPCTAVLTWEIDNTDPCKFGGAALGLTDGTVLLFRSMPVRKPDPAAISLPSRSASPFRRTDATSRSRSSSFMQSNPPFHVNSRSKIVSGITTEQVEAPKNYVDFEDEPSKLKSILQGKNPKEKPAVDSLALPPSQSHSTDVVSSPRKRKEPPKSLLSATNSPSFPLTPVSSLPDSPKTPTNQAADMTLLCHIIPPHTGAGNSVADMSLFDNNSHLAVLQESGDLSIYSTRDGSCEVTIGVEPSTLTPPEGVREIGLPHDVWVWKHLLVFNFGLESPITILLAFATIDANVATPTTLDAKDDETHQRSRICIFELSGSDQTSCELDEFQLEKIGEWRFDGLVGGIFSRQGIPTLYTVNSEGHLNLKTLQVLPALSTEVIIEPSSNLTLLPLPNPFKSLKARSTEHLPEKENPLGVAGRIVLGEDEDLGSVISENPLSGVRILVSDGIIQGAAWSESTLSLFELQNDKGLQIMHTTSVLDIQDIAWVDEKTYSTVTQDRVESFSLDAVDGNADLTTNDSETNSWRPTLMNSVALEEHDAMYISYPLGVITTAVDSLGQRNVKIIRTYDDSHKDGKPSVLWKAPRKNPQMRPRPTSMLPLELDVIIAGYDDGHIRETSLSRMCEAEEMHAPNTQKCSDSALPAHAVALNLVTNSRTSEKYVVGGGDDGSIAFWTWRSLKLCARWVVFTTPLASVIATEETPGAPLRGCALCISQDGTIAVIAVDGFQFLYLVPGSSSPLRRILIGEDNLLLVYADRRARLWDSRTRQFWRSMTLDKAEELVAQGGWKELTAQLNDEVKNECGLHVLDTTHDSPTAAATLVLNLEMLLSKATSAARGHNDPPVSIVSLKKQIRTILSTLLTPGLNTHIDVICSQTLGIVTSTASTGFSRLDTSSLYIALDRPHEPWCISPVVSAARALNIMALLKALSLVEDVSDDASTVIAYYATSLANSVGAAFCPPSLPFLARRWFDGSNEIRQTARILFDASVTRLTDDETIVLAEKWQHHLPCLHPTVSKESLPAALALFLCGYMAAEKYTLFSTSALMDISKSITLYLHDEESSHRVLAIDLCSRGFHIWQNYVDALEILRALFTLATTSRKQTITPQNVGAQARLAVLHIASTNTPLFMTTLSLDILHPLGVEHRKSVMQIVAFLIRKKPLVLYPHLPKLMEAVVKSLDPNSTQNREAVLDTVTEILGHVVKTFPSVDFHMGSQRLAVGTSEGAIIMYDLKTATRLYVLEGHKKTISACSFSPDGRRMVTVSLEERYVLVWKVGSSISSFLFPGAPPRQGHGGSEPYKSFPFGIADGDMSVEDTLTAVRFVWTADRRIALNIRDTVLNFDT